MGTALPQFDRLHLYDLFLRPSPPERVSEGATQRRTVEVMKKSIVSNRNDLGTT
jgi:hypothetical protein